MEAPIVLLNDDLDRPVYLELEQGELVVFSHRAPTSSDANEDSALVFPTEDGVILAVADGAGGCAEGEKASRLAIEALVSHLSPTEHAGAAEAMAQRESRASILDAFEQANSGILSLGSGAATTLSVIQVATGLEHIELRPFHAGDSSVLVTGGRGKIKLNTIPHSPVGYAVEAGYLDQDEALHHSDLNIVSNLVGMPDMRIEMGSALSLSTMDTVVIGTDGLFDNMQIAEIVQLSRRGPLLDAAELLLKLAQSRMTAPSEGAPSKPDDLTFALFRPRRQKRHRARVVKASPRNPAGSTSRLSA